MGWCSGTVIFDNVLEEILTEDGVKEGPIDAAAVIRVLANALWDGDWDCECDSAFFNHPLVRKFFEEKHPHWYED